MVKQIRKIVALCMALLILISLTMPTLAAGVTVKLDGAVLGFDVPAQIIDGRTMVPMRKIFESLGASVDWVESEKGIVATKGSKIIVMKIGSPLMVVADVSSDIEERLTLDVPPCIIDSRTLVPVRAISECLGVQVDWDAASKTVLLSTVSVQPQGNTDPQNNQPVQQEDPETPILPA